MPSKRTIPRDCEHCHKPFFARVSETNRGGGRFCSQACASASVRGTSSGCAPELLPDGCTARIPLHKRGGEVVAYALIDADRIEWASAWRWQLLRGAYATRNEFIEGRRRTIFLHREVLGLTPDDPLEGDHINRNKLDCRRSNLRAVTHAQNRQNTPSERGATSPFRGVSWCTAAKKWTVRVRVDGKARNFGSYTDELEAAAVARAARARYLPWAVD